MAYKAPKKDNKNFINFEAYEEDMMYSWIRENLEKLWEINIERFPSGATIVKFRKHQEAEENHDWEPPHTAKAKPQVDDDL